MSTLHPEYRLAPLSLKKAWIFVVALFIIPSVNFSQAQRLLGLGTPEDVFFLNKDTALFAISERAIAVTYNG